MLSLCLQHKDISNIGKKEKWKERGEKKRKEGKKGREERHVIIVEIISMIFMELALYVLISHWHKNWWEYFCSNYHAFVVTWEHND